MDVLMSIQPRFAEQILSGSKRFEIRRRRPSFTKGSTVWIYSSRPCQRIVGCFIVGEILGGSPARLWEMIGEETAVSETELHAYLAGSGLGFAIEAMHPQRLERPVPIGNRSLIPQSYRFLGSRPRERRLSTLLQTGLPHTILAT